MHLGSSVINAAHTASTFYFTHNDWLGTERVRTTPTGTTTGTSCETIASLPFGDGQVVNSTCGDVSPLHFTGKERDSESNNDNFGARYYASMTGRFLTPDWDARPIAVPYAVFGDPQSLNLYAYVRNDPVTSADADGHTLWGPYGAAVEECTDTLGCVPPGAVQQQAKSSEKDESTESTLAEQNQISPPPAVPGTLTINTVSTGDSSFTDGHAWITFTPDGRRRGKCK
jgi:RHS repeat-associated protein